MSELRFKILLPLIKCLIQFSILVRQNVFNHRTETETLSLHLYPQIIYHYNFELFWSIKT